MSNTTYENPLISRYASKQMSQIFSEQKRISYFRKLWVALAEAEMELGLDISQSQIDEMKQYVKKINFDVAKEKEYELRHDVMAHIHAFGTQAKSAMPIIHLGATSCYVTDNADILVYLEALSVVKEKLLAVISRLSDFAMQYKQLPTLGFTHLQPAQLTTVGKRATLWIQELLLDLENLDFLITHTRLRGAKGTTGTQASFLSLFEGDHEKVKALDRLIAKKMKVKAVYAVSGQTYTRKYDYNMLSVLSQIAQSAYKFSNDLRILQSMKEMEEPFEKTQVGSSAMAYKRNPMRSERISSLSRFVLSLPVNAAITSSTQWFERTLDDSANRRIVIAQAFLAVDGILNLYINVSENMVVYEKMIQKHIKEELPFMATENILMACVKAGGNRQELHERIRAHSMESAKAVKLEGHSNDLISRLKSDQAFAAVHNTLDDILDAKNFVGRAPEQTEEFIKEQVAPVLQKNKKHLKIISAEIKV